MKPDGQLQRRCVFRRGNTANLVKKLLTCLLAGKFFLARDITTAFRIPIYLASAGGDFRDPDKVFRITGPNDRLAARAEDKEIHDSEMDGLRGTSDLFEQLRSQWVVGSILVH